MLEKKQITLAWSGLSATVGEKVLLHECQGYCKPGEMLAIMGPSGAGKTTLLSLISKKSDPKLTVSGEIKANNQKFSASQFNNFGAFVYQDDTLHEMLTVRETLQFAAFLKFKNPVEALQRVNNLIQEFELQKCQNSYVGGQIKKGVSGGQKKRVCIAVQMVSKPSLMILDEPTSGLDSHKAGSVLKILKKLTVKQNCTIIFTIHQPSYLLYSKLTRLILLDKGLVIYQGCAQQITTYIERLNIPINPHSTISDFFMMEISQYKAKKDQYLTPFNYNNYLLYLAPTVQKQLKKIQEQQSGFALLKAATSFFFMFATLFQRQWRMLIRNPSKTISFFINLAVGIIMSGVFFINTITSSENLIQLGQTLSAQDISQVFIGIQGSSFINITSVVFTGIFAVQLAFPVDRAIYYKESSSKKYFPIAYFLSKASMELIHISIYAIVYGSSVYWVNGYDHSLYKFLRYLFTMVMMGAIGNSIGYFVGALFKQVDQASAMGSLITLPLMAFSGMYNKLNNTPTWISWMQYISPFRYGLQMILVNQYEDLRIPIVQNGSIIDYYVYNEDLAFDPFWQNAYRIAALTVAFYLMTFIILKKLSSKLST